MPCSPQPSFFCSFSLPQIVDNTPTLDAGLPWSVLPSRASLPVYVVFAQIAVTLPPSKSSHLVLDNHNIHISPYSPSGHYKHFSLSDTALFSLPANLQYTRHILILTSTLRHGNHNSPPPSTLLSAWSDIARDCPGCYRPKYTLNFRHDVTT